MNKSFLSVTANKSEEAEVLIQQITFLLYHILNTVSLLNQEIKLKQR